MDAKARDIMVREFDTVAADAPLKEAVKKLHEAQVRATGYKAFGIPVVDSIGHVTGMLSMFDVIYHLRPPFMNYELESFSAWEGELGPYLERFEGLKVEEVMSTPVATAEADDHVMVVMDRMVKRRARRLPVVEGNRMIGMIYLSDVFHYLCKSWL
ncbi:CBS domain-containing protein [Desulfatiglans anilini]|uniref:CBS domain-containing protein n=1 Tax=Desulfatiglans anilini TaxID=90728 RepID=UPI000489F1F8|nr:CBS domain-containing protein [Desulfatiglans anilini]